MKVYKDDSPFEQAVQKVEALMQELGLRIDGGYLMITRNASEGKTEEADIMDVDTKERMTAFPRFTESERLVIRE